MKRFLIGLRDRFRSPCILYDRERGKYCIAKRRYNPFLNSKLGLYEDTKFPYWWHIREGQENYCWGSMEEVARVYARYVEYRRQNRWWRRLGRHFTHPRYSRVSHTKALGIAALSKKGGNGGNSI